MNDSQETLQKELKKNFGKRVVFNYPLSLLTTMKIGGPAPFLIRAKSEEDIKNIVAIATRYRISWKIMGGASNIIPQDDGFSGILIKNEILDLTINNPEKICTVGSGYPLLSFIYKLNANGLAGMEKMAGIPGTIGGAIYGCAGAYGQEIKDCLYRVHVFDGKKTRWVSRSQCKFGYRTSIFRKYQNWVIIAAEFKLSPESPSVLKKTSRHIVSLREKKYPKGLSCPGSFFKNIVVDTIHPVHLKEKFLAKIDIEKINHGKLAAGYLLEKVGACGLHKNNIAVAQYHGNLIYNTGGGTTKDLKHLAQLLKTKVRKKFGITLEEEVQYLN